MRREACAAEREAGRIERRLARQLRDRYRAIDRAESAGDRADADARRLDATAAGLLFGRLREVLEAHADDHPAEAEALGTLIAIEHAVDAVA